MSFTTAQLQTIKTAIQGDATALADWNAGNTQGVCDYMNAAPASPVQLWRPDIAASVLLTGVVWSAFVGLTSGAQAAWQALTSGGTVDSTNANIRAGFTAIFGAGSQTLTNLTAIAQRPASRLEALFTTLNVCSVYGAILDVPTLNQAMV